MILKQNVPGQALPEHFEVFEFTLGNGSLEFVAPQLIGQHDLAILKVLHGVALHENTG